VLRIQRALLVELLVVFVMITTVVTTAVFLGSTIHLLAQGVGALGAELLMEVIPKLLPVAFAFSLPFAWLAAVALVLGRWTSDHEVTALRAAGVHSRVVALPILALGALLAAAGMHFNAYTVPIASREMKVGLREMVPQFLGSLRGSDRSVILSQGRLSFERWSDGAFWNVEIDRRRDDGLMRQKAWARRLTLAPQAGEESSMGLVFDLQDAVVMTAQDDGSQAVERRDSVQMPMGVIKSIAASTPFNELFGSRAFQYRAKDMTLPELVYVDERGGVERSSRQRAMTRFHGRLSLGATTFFMGLFAVAMLLVLPPSSRRVRDFNLCFLPCIFTFFPLYILGPPMARDYGWPPWLALWLSNLVLGAAALVLLYLGRRR
jgi:lipopolysaccharide export system permease protein